MKELFRHLPKKHQIFLLRNWGMLSIDTISKILSCTQDTVLFEASLLGLPDYRYDSIWLEKGYLTIIRNNWDLVTLEQLAKILGWSVKKLKTTLVEEDFLLTKLGGMRDNAELCYQPLSKDEQDATKRISILIKENFKNDANAKPFDFYQANASVVDYTDNNNQSIKISFSYSMLFGDVLMQDPELSFSDDMLAMYRNIGINGLWIPAILYQLNPLFFDLSYCADYETRIKHLNEIITRTEKYGIKIYLYLNEPRGMPTEFFDKFPTLKGTFEKGINALCTSVAGVKEYIKNSVEYLCKNAPKLGGIITITISENLTNCYSREGSMCPQCAKREKTEVVAEVNNLIYEGIKNSGSNAKLIVWNWGWTYPNWNMEDNKRIIDLLPKDSIFMCVSEDEFEFEKGNVKGKVKDYSISNVGPSNKSKQLLKYASQQGHETMAKVQINNSWECSFVPYIPVFNLILTHLKNLHEINVNDMMTCWSLGGYPAAGLDLINADFDKSDEEILNNFYKRQYGVEDERINKGIELLSKGFSNFPFSLCILYNGTQNYNISNLLYLNKTNMSASMVGFCYDDIKSWIYPYQYEDYIKLIKQLLTDWKKGMELIDCVNEQSPQIMELKRMVKAVYVAFVSVYNQAVFTALRDGISQDNNKIDTMQTIIDCEINLAKEMLRIQREDARIGFEASNHYFFTQNNLVEKIVNCNYLKEQLIKQKN